MRKRNYAIILLAMTAMLVIGGCSSSKFSRFYVLTAVSQETVPPEPCVSLGVGPVRLPEYLDRSQIITRTGRNELSMAQNDRWAEPLSNTIPRVMAQNLSRLLCTRTILTYPYRATERLDYRVEVNVLRMDGQLGREAVLEAWWSVTDGVSKKVIITERSLFTESTQGDHYDDYVKAHDRAIAALCREIAKAIMLLLSHTGK